MTIIILDEAHAWFGWSSWVAARDIQKWEYVPLGPFLGKSFGTHSDYAIIHLAIISQCWGILCMSVSWSVWADFSNSFGIVMLKYRNNNLAMDCNIGGSRTIYFWCTRAGWQYLKWLLLFLSWKLLKICMLGVLKWKKVLRTNYDCGHIDRIRPRSLIWQRRIVKLMTFHCRWFTFPVMMCYLNPLIISRKWWNQVCFNVSFGDQS
jgi:hypothetical protein